MATAAAVRRDVKEYMFAWEGRDRGGKLVKGDMKATGEAVVQSTLRRQGISVLKVKRQRAGMGGRITEKDITLFTRQLATMMKSGVPLLQSFDIVGKGHANPAVGKLLLDIKTDVETGSSLNQAFRKFPLYFDQLFCNLVGGRRGGRYPGQPAGPAGDLQGKDPCHQEQDQVGVVLSDRRARGGLHHHRGHHDLRHPGVQGAVHQLRRRLAWPYVVRDELVGPVRRLLVADLRHHWRRPLVLLLHLETLAQDAGGDGPLDAKLPIFGAIIRKATMARWTRTLSTMFAAGVPLVEALESVGGAAGNYIYIVGTKEFSRR